MGPGAPKARASTVEPALALVELSSVVAGVQAADAMAKRASIDVLKAGTVHNGKYLVLVGGQVADVEESLAAGREVGGAPCRTSCSCPTSTPKWWGRSAARARPPPRMRSASSRPRPGERGAQGEVREGEKGEEDRIQVPSSSRSTGAVPSRGGG